MSRRADDAPRREIKMYDPDDAVIIGYDTKDGPEHDLYDGRSNSAPVLDVDVEFTVEHGILEPIACRRDGDRILVVFGRGRTKQLRAANKIRIAKKLEPWLLPVQIVKGDSTKMKAIKVGENYHRREIDPITRAETAYELSQCMPEERAAVQMGLSVQQLRNSIKLLDLSPTASKAVVAGNLSATAAMQFTGLSHESQDAKIAKLGAKPKVREAKAAAIDGPVRDTPTAKIRNLIEAIDGATLALHSTTSLEFKEMYLEFLKTAREILCR